MRRNNFFKKTVKNEEKHMKHINKSKKHTNKHLFLQKSKETKKTKNENVRTLSFLCFCVACSVLCCAVLCFCALLYVVVFCVCVLLWLFLETVDEAHVYVFLLFLLVFVPFFVGVFVLEEGGEGTVNRTPSHRIFSRTCAHISSLFTCTEWLKGVAARVS